jgi:hypothetical protein
MCSQAPVGTTPRRPSSSPRFAFLPITFNVYESNSRSANAFTPESKLLVRLFSVIREQERRFVTLINVYIRISLFFSVNRRRLAPIAYSELARQGRRRWALFIRRRAMMLLATLCPSSRTSPTLLARRTTAAPFVISCRVARPVTGSRVASDERDSRLRSRSTPRRSSPAEAPRVASAPRSRPRVPALWPRCPQAASAFAA